MIAERADRNDLLDGDQHLARGASHREIQRARPDDLDIAAFVGALGVQNERIDPQSGDDADLGAVDGVARDLRVRHAGQHVRSLGKLERHRRQVLLRGAQGLDHGECCPVAHGQGVRLGGCAKAWRQAENIEAGEADIDLGNSFGLQKQLERQAARPRNVAQVFYVAPRDGAEQSDWKPREVVAADAEPVAEANHGGQFLDLHEAWPVRLDQRHVLLAAWAGPAHGFVFLARSALFSANSRTRFCPISLR